MRQFFFFILMILCLTLFAACGQQPAPMMEQNAPKEPAETPIDTKPVRVTVTSDGETIYPHRSFVCSFDGEFFADGGGLYEELEEVHQSLPRLRLGEDFHVNFGADTVVENVLLYDTTLNPLTYEGSISGLQELPSGVYYVGIYLMTYGEYDEREKIRTYTGLEYGFCLIVE